MARRPAMRHAMRPVALAALLLLLLPAAVRAGIVARARVVPPHTLELTLRAALPRTDAANFRLSEAESPDVAIPVRVVRATPRAVVLEAAATLDRARAYTLALRAPDERVTVKLPPWALLLAVVLSAALINNFVFTRYLGLCIFFGVTKKRDTALGMGITFTAVMVLTGMGSWALYQFVMKPLTLGFLQVLVFIGMVAFVVQLLDTVLKKTHRALHQRFGIYLVLITTNCIILAVPLLNAASGAGSLESFALAMGSGAGFALALFLMSCAREGVELARVPKSFEGLPIAFALAGLFALAFMGFSGLDLFR
jgi:H+/Na+-translocating ferredoxin:NAD+ oxidoreductase subunit A